MRSPSTRRTLAGLPVQRTLAVLRWSPKQSGARYR